jgi:hypothetical protein
VLCVRGVLCLWSSSLGNESEVTIYNFNSLDWAAIGAIKRKPHAWPRLQALHLYGNRLAIFGANSLVRPNPLSSMHCTKVPKSASTVA